MVPGVLHGRPGRLPALLNYEIVHQVERKTCAEKFAGKTEQSAFMGACQKYIDGSNFSHSDSSAKWVLIGFDCSLFQPGAKSLPDKANLAPDLAQSWIVGR